MGYGTQCSNRGSATSPTPIQGLKNAIGQVLGARWQRSTVQFVRDMLGHARRTNQPLVRGALKQVFAAPDRQSAGETLADAASQRGPPRARWLGCWRRPRRSCWYMRFPRADQSRGNPRRT